jgi:hypothetical protein
VNKLSCSYSAASFFTGVSTDTPFPLPDGDEHGLGVEAYDLKVEWILVLDRRPDPT